MCIRDRNYADQVAAGIIKDESFLSVIFAAGKDDDWKDPATWAKANPNFDVTVQQSFYEQECAKAVSLPSYENTFRRLYLNQWTEQDVRWLSMDAWDACAAPMPDLDGLPCFAALDLSSTTDITALVLGFPVDGKVHLLPFFWIPAEGVKKRVDRDRVPYSQWIKDGFIMTTPGKVIDYEFIRRKINELAEQYHIKEVAIDRWNATQLSTQLEGDGFEMVGFGQGFASMASPTKELERRILEGTLNHGANPVMRWMASNITTEQDAAGNLKPSKKKSTERIDGIVATIMALGRIMLTDDLSVSTGEVFFV